MSGGLSRLQNVVQFRRSKYHNSVPICRHGPYCHLIGLPSGAKQAIGTVSDVQDLGDPGSEEAFSATSTMNNHADTNSILTGPNSYLHLRPEKDFPSRIESRSSNQSMNNSDESRRSSAASSMALGASGTAKLGKRKRRTENDESIIESNYSLRRRRGSRMVNDEVNGTHDADPSQQNSTNLPGIEIEDAPEAPSVVTDSNGMDIDRDELPDSLAPLVPKRRGRRPYRTRAGTPAESMVGTPVPGTPLNGNEVGTGVGTDQEPTKLVRRLPGRRRAPNANPHIEADLRRQLNLKMSYRSIVKALKPVLAELSRRSIGELEDDVDAYKKCDEYEDVTGGLEVYLKRRLDQVNSQLECGWSLNDQELEDGQEYYQKQFEVRRLSLPMTLICKLMPRRPRSNT
jgi:hypothetical protein